jgi:hypothetical protein
MTTVSHIVLLWAAVFIGLDLAFGAGVLTDGVYDSLQRLLRWVRETLRL